ncbi:MAG: formate/nitrite transporter family protein [Candidatus Acidiferrales bacterium]
MMAKKQQELEEPPPTTLTTKAEQKKVEERVAIGAHVVHETIRREGEDELKRSSQALAWSGLAAGLSMGFSLVAEALLAGHLPERPWAPLISKLGYSVGFLIVILGRQQLFTENTVTVVLPLLLRKNMQTTLQVLRLWCVVLGANLVGTFLFAVCIQRIPIFSPEMQRAFTSVSQASAGFDFWVVLIRAVFAGWLIALMVWLLPAAENSHVSIIIIITYLIGLGGFSHVVAGSTKMFYLVVTGAMTWGAYFGHFFAPCLIGNILGGVSLVAALGHAQVVAGKES